MITVDKLQDQCGKPGPRPVLYCERCGGEYSANRGDYFWMRSNEIIMCCDKLSMKLVMKKIVYEEVE